MSTYDNNGVEFYNDLVLATAIKLIVEKGLTTTLDIKNELRQRYEVIDLGNISFKPFFTQNQISDSMNWLASNNYFTYVDNGVYRNYYLNKNLFSNSSNNKDLKVDISIVEAFDIINDLAKDDFIIITFTKHDNSVRTINGCIYSPNKGDGYIKLVDLDLPDGDDGTNIRTVDLRRLISFEYDSIKYTIDKNIK